MKMILITILIVMIHDADKHDFDNDSDVGEDNQDDSFSC